MVEVTSAGSRIKASSGKTRESTVSRVFRKIRKKVGFTGSWGKKEILSAETGPANPEPEKKKAKKKGPRELAFEEANGRIIAIENSGHNRMFLSNDVSELMEKLNIVFDGERGAKDVDNLKCAEMAVRAGEVLIQINKETPANLREDLSIIRRGKGIKFLEWAALNSKDETVRRNAVELLQIMGEVEFLMEHITGKDKQLAGMINEVMPKMDGEKQPT